MPTLTVGPGEPDNARFGEILLHFRTRKKLGRAVAASRMRFTSEYLRLIERGERTPALGTAMQMLDMYDVPYTLNLTQLIFQGGSVNFVSRIKEARKQRSMMPEIRYFTVIQKRTVKVSANNPTDAAILAERVFSGTKKPEDQINIQAEVREVSVVVKEGR